jgi:hemin uptake protein HemP
MLLAGTALVAFQPMHKQETMILGKICFKIKNDTGSSQTLHTGSGTTSINNLTTNEICIEEGGALYLAERGNKGKVLLKVTSSVSGKTFELSKLMK